MSDTPRTDEWNQYARDAERDIMELKATNERLERELADSKAENEKLREYAKGLAQAWYEAEGYRVAPFEVWLKNKEASDE